uniref:Uncharacterized protein n=1 Tax=Rhizophora mucronata TaxID=61149 RepID=A0A2P2NYV9_RHIMU
MPLAMNPSPTAATVAERKVVQPSTTFLLAFTTVFPIPSPTNISFVFFLSTSTFSK